MGEWRNYSQGRGREGLLSAVRPKKIRVGGGGKIAPGETGGRNWERRRGKVDGLRSNERIFLFSLFLSRQPIARRMLKEFRFLLRSRIDEGAGGMPSGEKRVFDVFLAEGIGSHCFYAFPFSSSPPLVPRDVERSTNDRFSLLFLPSPIEKHA